MTNILSLNSRKIFLSEIDLILNVDSTEFPEPKMISKDKSLREEYANVDFDKRIYMDCVNALGGTRSTVLTFERWRAIQNEVLAILKKNSFKENISEVYGGTSLDKKKEIETWISESIDLLEKSSNIYNEPGTFVDEGLRHYLLNPIALSKSSTINNRFLDYTGEPTLIQSVFWDLRTKGFTEMEVMNWNRLTKSLNSPLLRATKDIYESIKDYEISFAGSPKLIQVLLKDFRKFCRGAAYVVLSASAFSTASALVQKDIHALAFYLIGGGVATLAFISIGPIASRLEDFISKKSNKVKPSKSGK